MAREFNGSNVMGIQIHNIHAWNIGYREAADIQERLRSRVVKRPLRLGSIRVVAGADIAVSKRLDRLVAAVVVLTFPALDVIEERIASMAPPFPYVPGFLSFREIPVLAKCLRKVSHAVDVLLCDAQGIAHPRGLGLASHVGLLVDIPTIGCAKSRLVGEFDEPGNNRGDFSQLLFEGRRVGSVLRTRDGVKPLFVSPGNRVDMASSRRVTLACCSRYRLPEPTRLAHIAAGAAKRGLEGRS